MSQIRRIGIRISGLRQISQRVPVYAISEVVRMAVLGLVPQRICSSDEIAGIVILIAGRKKSTAGVDPPLDRGGVAARTADGRMVWNAGGRIRSDFIIKVLCLRELIAGAILHGDCGRTIENVVAKRGVSGERLAHQ